MVRVRGYVHESKLHEELACRADISFSGWQSPAQCGRPYTTAAPSRHRGLPRSSSFTMSQPNATLHSPWV